MSFFFLACVFAVPKKDGKVTFFRKSMTLLLFLTSNYIKA